MKKAPLNLTGKPFLCVIEIYSQLSNKKYPPIPEVTTTYAGIFHFFIYHFTIISNFY